MPDSLADIFMIAAIVVAGDFLLFGMAGLEAQIGHGSIWDPQPFVPPETGYASFWSLQPV